MAPSPNATGTADEVNVEIVGNDRSSLRKRIEDLLTQQEDCKIVTFKAYDEREKEWETFAGGKENLINVTGKIRKFEERIKTLMKEEEELEIPKIRRIKAKDSLQLTRSYPNGLNKSGVTIIVTKPTLTGKDETVENDQDSENIQSAVDDSIETCVKNDHVVGNGQVVGNDHTAGNGHVVGNGHAIGNGHTVGNGHVGNGHVGNGHTVGTGHTVANGHVIGNGHTTVGNGHVIGNGNTVGNGHVVRNGHTVTQENSIEDTKHIVNNSFTKSPKTVSNGTTVPKSVPNSQSSYQPIGFKSSLVLSLFLHLTAFYGLYILSTASDQFVMTETIYFACVCHFISIGLHHILRKRLTIVKSSKPHRLLMSFLLPYLSKESYFEWMKWKSPGNKNQDNKANITENPTNSSLFGNTDSEVSYKGTKSQVKSSLINSTTISIVLQAFVVLIPWIFWNEALLTSYVIVGQLQNCVSLYLCLLIG